MAAWRRGFYAETTILYDFDRFGFDDYVSDLTRATKLRPLNDTPGVLDDKLVFALFMRDAHLPTPRVFGYAERGRPVWFDELGRMEGLQSLLRREGRLVVKPRFGTGGRNIAFLSWDGNSYFKDDQRVDSVNSALREGQPIVSEFVEQDEYARHVWPHSSNTMRVVTLRESAVETPYVAAAVHKFGTSTSRRVDNWGKGGLSARIDLTTGRLGPAVAGPLYTGGAPVWHDRHPDTDAPIAGSSVPRWRDVLDSVVRAAAAFEGLRYVGWDVLVTPNGPTVLEGNNRSNVNYIQAHGPLLRDRRVRQFFTDNRLIPGSR